MSSLFAAVLGVNPIQHLLAAARRAWPRCRPRARQTLTGREFFPDLISGPFHHGLIVVFAVAAVLAALAALASACAAPAPPRLARRPPRPRLARRPPRPADRPAPADRD